MVGGGGVINEGHQNIETSKDQIIMIMIIMIIKHDFVGIGSHHPTWAWQEFSILWGLQLDYTAITIVECWPCFLGLFV